MDVRLALKSFWLTSALALGLSASSAPANLGVNEALLRAMFIERFTRFIDWPRGASVRESSNFKLCVYQDKSLTKILEPIYAKMKIKGQAIITTHVSRLADAESCHLIYLPEVSAEQTDALNLLSSNHSVLIVGGEESAVEQDEIHINLYQVASKMQIQVNAEALRNSGFKVDSRLLKYAKSKNNRGGSR